MTREEAAKVMAVFAGAFPRVDLTPETVNVWFDASLERCDFELGLKLALDLIGNPARADKGFPRPADFNEALRIHRLHESMRHRPPELPPEPKTEAEKAKAHIDEARRLLGVKP